VVELTKGNLLDADAEVMVNTVNCVGYMGKGVALQFKKAFPENFKAYERSCRASQVRPGTMFVFARGTITNPRYIVNFPTKRHWRGPSRIEDIATGLQALVQEVRRLGVASVAIPPLGCGLGGLDWRVVRPMIESAFAELPGVHVLLFEPAGAPAARDMPIGTARQPLTVPRALYIRLMAQYSEQGYRLTLLELQKLAYFLQEAGQPLRLAYEAGHYGPYARNLNKVLEVLEGHYLSGYGDSQKPDVEIEILEGAVEEAARALEGRTAEHARLARVGQLIEGFDTPYGMELLSSVHWLAAHGEPRAQGAEDCVTGMAAWSERKRRMFRREHIQIAWDQLASHGWTGPNGGTPA
jgi:O-acetyl-ADP-ribose deacetylase (regulator of RNase III)